MVRDGAKLYFTSRWRRMLQQIAGWSESRLSLTQPKQPRCTFVQEPNYAYN